VPSDTISIFVLVALVLLVVDVPLFFWWRERERNRDRESVLPAHDRAAAVVQRALDAYRSAEFEEPRLQRPDLWVRALMAGSSESAAAAKVRVAKAAQRSEPQATLQMLLVGIAVEQEHDLAFAGGPEQLTSNIAEARQTVMALVPLEM